MYWTTRGILFVKGLRKLFRWISHEWKGRDDVRRKPELPVGAP